MSKEDCEKVAEAIMKIHKNVVTVMAQVGSVHGDFRLRKLQYIAGRNKTLTVHREWGCLFSVDVEKSYFSPRLSYERMRIARRIRKGEIVLNMFAGVGCFSVLAARYSGCARVYSVDVNPSAVQHMRENVRRNGVSGVVVPFLGDAKRLVEKGVFHGVDRVLMPLPEKAYEYLPHALLALEKTRGWIHNYHFEHAKKNEDASQETKLKVAERLGSLGIPFRIPFCRVVRKTGPNWYQTVLDIEVTKE
jgi:tRNA (guanine37-N1)-methyltransferase